MPTEASLSNADYLAGWYRETVEERRTVDSTRQEIADNEFGKGDFTVQRWPGQDRTPLLFDTTALFARQQLAGFIHGAFTNPASQWFDIVPEDRRLLDDFDVAFWLDDARRKMLSVLNGGSSNFTAAAAESYLDISGFGMSALSVLSRPGRGIRYQAWPLRCVYIVVDSDGDVRTIFLHREMTLLQILERYGDRALAIDEVKRAKDNNDRGFCMDVVQVITPSSDPLAGTSPFRKKWTSVHFAPETKKAQILESRGFDENPILTPRWEVEDGETYGRGPGWGALSDQCMLNEIARVVLVAAQKAADPPLLVSSEAVLDGIRTVPGGINVVEDLAGVGGAPDAIRPLRHEARVEIAADIFLGYRQSVRNHFWAQVLQLFEDPRMTATQVIELANQTQRLMAPMMARLQREFLEPLITRTFNLMLRARMFLRPVPAALRGQEIKITYVSPIARAQKQVEAAAVLRTYEGATAIASATGDPSVFDNFDHDEAARILAEANSAPVRILRNQDEKMRLREARALQAQTDAELDEADQASEIVKKLSDAFQQRQAA